MTEKMPERDKSAKKGRKGDSASKSSSRIWGEARKEIIPLSIGAIALIASSSVNQGTCSAFSVHSRARLSIEYDFLGTIWSQIVGREEITPDEVSH